VKQFVLILLLASWAIGTEPRGPFHSPVTGFSDALVPILTGFEKAQIETALRGFIARADSFPGFERSDMEPSEHGLYLNVAVRDATEVDGLSDRSELKGAVTHRVIEIPPPTGGEQALVILLNYGRDVPPEVIKAIDSASAKSSHFQRSEPNPIDSRTPQTIVPSHEPPAQ
jgi:hypothetical protein